MISRSTAPTTQQHEPKSGAAVTPAGTAAASSPPPASRRLHANCHLLVLYDSSRCGWRPPRGCRPLLVLVLVAPLARRRLQGPGFAQRRQLLLLVYSASRQIQTCVDEFVKARWPETVCKQTTDEESG